MAKKASTKKVFVLDTSVLLYSSSSIYSFGNSRVVIPLGVLDELDKFRTREDELGKNARAVSRVLYELSHEGDISTGVPLGDSGGIISVDSRYSETIPKELVNDNVDNRIVGLCDKLSSSGENVTLITKDINLAVKAKVMGCSSEDFVDTKTVNNTDDIYTGATTIDVDDSVIDYLYAHGESQYEGSLFPNQFAIAKSTSNPKKTAIVRCSALGTIRLIRKKSVWGIEPRNLQQMFSLDVLTDDSVSLVTLAGVAGSGKTLCAVAAGLQKVMEERVYESLVITRPMVAVGKSEMGFLPGSLQEKYEPWIRPIKDAVSVLFNQKSSNRDDIFEDFMERGIVKIEPLTYIRGRSFQNSYMILDETQNLSRHEIKTFLTRAGDNTKVVLTGDIMQIDSPFLDSISNGLSQAIERFKNEDLSAHVSLMKGERSRLATIAASIL